jgi:hypothetical protein
MAQSYRAILKMIYLMVRDKNCSQMVVSTREISKTGNFTDRVSIHSQLRAKFTKGSGSIMKFKVMELKRHKTVSFKLEVPSIKEF